jgi:hypothetical protein
LEGLINLGNYLIGITEKTFLLKKGVMGKQVLQDLMSLDDDFLNDLAADWYFLNLHFQSRILLGADEFSNQLIEFGVTLKRYLIKGGFTFLQPMNVYVDTDTFFDIWMDAGGDIQVSDLYTDAD